MDLREAFRGRARAEGFDRVGFTAAQGEPIWTDRLNDFLDLGHHGEMAWMATRKAERADPQTLWPQARTAIVLTLNYGPASDPMEGLTRKGQGLISCYAQGDDYHDIIKPKLKRLGHWLYEQSGANVKVFVDTAPVMEKPLAERAGLGWQGKHTNLVSRDLGSWTFLGVILTELALPSDAPETDHCGSCRACLDICPTRAFPKPYQLDARRCISYLTIEHHGPIPRNLRTAMGNRIYGCDDCLAVCPWNKFAERAHEARLHARAEQMAPRLADLVQLEDQDFRQVFARSPIKRIGRDRFVRNVLIATGNSGDAEMIPAALARLRDPSGLVRGAAVWALSQLMGPQDFAASADEHEPAEADPDVQAEWAQGRNAGGGTAGAA
ncbi:MAG TPA: tRNA epoxyqueuosine(34) reductase QueG [Alphaproteobacteria bacterium]|nr:tRNA epoxyqueuosine(34) reductase QueG [Alphaproteobacteria bacterium]HAJ45126.1 tRNA epoxyqueuosine(34) reductase QueG [Alphaproteobacteria bacterium]